MPLEWGYGKSNGPETWPKLFPEAKGVKQSPINIKPVDIKVLENNKKLTWKYMAESSDVLTNTGCGWRVNVSGDGSLLTGGPLRGDYKLEQFHCHWGETDSQGSEHTIDGKRFSGELHFVHWNSTKYKTFEEAANYPDGLCVLGVFLKPGKKHQELHKIVTELKHVQYRGDEVKILEPVNPDIFIPNNSGYYTYQGSLTTPPCSECVIWIVFKEPIEVSQEQLQAFRNLKSHCVKEQCPIADEFKGLVKTNFRPTLPLGRREILECRQ